MKAWLFLIIVTIAGGALIACKEGILMALLIIVGIYIGVTIFLYLLDRYLS